MVRLLPTVHCLLVVLPRLEEHDIDLPGVGGVLELVELLSDGMADVGGGDAESVEGGDFGSLGLPYTCHSEQGVEFKIVLRSATKPGTPGRALLTERYHSL
jgi:hypothetical protein